MLGEEVLEEYITLALPTSKVLTQRDIPVRGILALARVESSSARVIFLETGTYLKISGKWLTFFSGLGNWGMEKLPEGSFIKDMAELCYGITATSILDPTPLVKVLKGSTEEFRKWMHNEFDPLELVGVSGTKEI